MDEMKRKNAVSSHYKNYFRFSDEQLLTLKRVFDVYDDDCDGRMSTDKLGEAMRAGGLPLTNQEIIDSIHEIDPTQRGDIDMGSFFIIMARRYRDLGDFEGNVVAAVKKQLSRRQKEDSLIITSPRRDTLLMSPRQRQQSSLATTPTDLLSPRSGSTIVTFQNNNNNNTNGNTTNSNRESVRMQIHSNRGSIMSGGMTVIKMEGGAQGGAQGGAAGMKKNNISSSSSSSSSGSSSSSNTNTNVTSPTIGGIILQGRTQLSSLKALLTTPSSEQLTEEEFQEFMQEIKKIEDGKLIYADGTMDVQKLVDFLLSDIQWTRGELPVENTYERDVAAAKMKHMNKIKKSFTKSLSKSATSTV